MLPQVLARIVPFLHMLRLASHRPAREVTHLAQAHTGANLLRGWELRAVLGGLEKTLLASRFTRQRSPLDS